MIWASNNPICPRRKQRHPAERPFLDAYADCGNVRAAAAAIGIDHKLHYRALKSDPEYRATFESLGDRVGQELEDLAVDRVRNGFKQQLFHKGKPIKAKNGHLVYKTEYDRNFTSPC